MYNVRTFVTHEYEILFCRCLDSIICIIAVSKISRLFQASVAMQASLSLTWTQNPQRQSLTRLPIWNSQNCSMFPLAFVAGWLQGHWWGFISRNYVVWPAFLLMNVFIALNGSHFWFLFDFTAAGVVPCGGRKTSPPTSTIVQFIFYFGPLRSAIIFWEIRNQWLV